MKSFKRHLEEKLKASDDMGDWVKDFQDSDAPQFKGKSQKERQKMAIAAKLAAERNEEVELDEVSDLQKDFISSMQSKLKKRSSLRDPNAKTAREEDKLAKQLAAKVKMKKEAVELDEVSDKKLDAYRQKAFADQPAGNDGSDKYRKRKFGRDLAFAKQTGRAKVLATKESVELDEAETKYVIKHKKTKQVLNTHDDYATAKDEHEGLGADKKDYGVYKQTKKDAALRNRNTYREEVELDEVSTDKLRDYASAALQDKDKAKADKRWKYASKAMKTVGDREAKAVHALKYNKTEETQLDEKAPKIKPDFLKTQREKDRAHDAAMGRTATSRKKPVRQMTSTQRSLASMRKEEAELDEAKTDIYHKHMLKALGKSRLPKDHQYTSAIANNGDFVVHDGGGRIAGRIAKGDHNLKD